MYCVNRYGKAKKRYYEVEDAIKARDRTQGDYKEEKFTIYRCKYCGAWHVGKCRQ
jgi:hypothetical protein